MLLQKIQILLKMSILMEGVFTANILFIISLYTLYPRNVMLLEFIHVFKIQKYFECI